MADNVKIVSPEVYAEICRLLDKACALELEAKGCNLTLRAKLELLNTAKAHRARAMELR